MSFGAPSAEVQCDNCPAVVDIDLCKGARTSWLGLRRTDIEANGWVWEDEDEHYCSGECREEAKA